MFECACVCFRNSEVWPKNKQRNGRNVNHQPSRMQVGSRINHCCHEPERTSNARTFVAVHPQTLHQVSQLPGETLRNIVFQFTCTTSTIFDCFCHNNFLCIFLNIFFSRISPSTIPWDELDAVSFLAVSQYWLVAIVAKGCGTSVSIAVFGASFSAWRSTYLQHAGTMPMCVFSAKYLMQIVFAMHCNAVPRCFCTPLIDSSAGHAIVLSANPGWWSEKKNDTYSNVRSIPDWL